MQSFSVSSLPPRLSNVFVPNSHGILSSIDLRRNQLSSSSSIHPLKLANSTHFGELRNFQTRRLNSSIKVAANPPEEIYEDQSVRTIKTKSSNIFDLGIRLIRPYILYGTLISFLAATARVYMENPFLPLNWSIPLRGLLSLSAMFGIDGYIMILNLISDVDIDRINKPYLPLASGEISMKQAWTWVISCAIHSIATALLLARNSMLPSVLLLLALGTSYSVRPFYAKKSTYGAIFTNSSMRGYTNCLVHFAAASATLGVPFRISPALVFMAVFDTLVTASLSIMKDLTDVEGDKKFNSRTLALTIGCEKASFVGFGLQFLAYFGSVAAAIWRPNVFRSSVVVPVHLLMGGYVAYMAWKLIKSNYDKDESKLFSQSSWMLLYLHTILFPFMIKL